MFVSWCHLCSTTTLHIVQNSLPPHPCRTSENCLAFPSAVVFVGKYETFMLHVCIFTSRNKERSLVTCVKLRWLVTYAELQNSWALVESTSILATVTLQHPGRAVLFDDIKVQRARHIGKRVFHDLCKPSQLFSFGIMLQKYFIIHILSVMLTHQVWNCFEFLHFPHLLKGSRSE